MRALTLGVSAVAGGCIGCIITYFLPPELRGLLWPSLALMGVGLLFLDLPTYLRSRFETWMLERYVLCDLPHRSQEGPTGGLAAVGMVMDYYHAQGLHVCTPLGQEGEIKFKCYDTTCPATQESFLIKRVQEAQWSTLGEIFSLEHLSLLARGYGYRTQVFYETTIDIILKHVSEKKPMIVPYYVGAGNHPSTHHGDPVSFAVIVGCMRFWGKPKWLIVRCGSDMQAHHHVWSVASFVASWDALRLSNFYRQRFRDRIPERPLKHAGSFSKSGLLMLGKDMQHACLLLEPAGAKK